MFHYRSSPTPLVFPKVCHILIWLVIVRVMPFLSPSPSLPPLPPLPPHHHHLSLTLFFIIREHTKSLVWQQRAKVAGLKWRMESSSSLNEEWRFLKYFGHRLLTWNAPSEMWTPIHIWLLNEGFLLHWLLLPASGHHPCMASDLYSPQQITSCANFQVKSEERTKVKDGCILFWLLVLKISYYFYALY